MRPYLAIIKDSFREALASRVLWILMILITLTLLVLAPIGWQRNLTWRLVPDDIRRMPRLIEELQQADSQPESPLSDVWGMLGSKVRARINEFEAENEDPFAPQRLRASLVREFNDLLERRDFYQKVASPDFDLNDEGSKLAARGIDTLSDDEYRRLNRLALESMFRGYIRSRPNKSVTFTYVHWELWAPLPVTDEKIVEYIQIALALFMHYFVGVVGVFAGILVTASIIPNTFDAGSVSLLLSKPVSRPLLYLAKFFGGCSFVFINATYLIAGLWLIAGARLGVWQHNLLWSIPIFLFIFVIYYSVSGLFGLVWRNTVICIVMTILFFCLCFAVEKSKAFIDLLVHHPNRIVGVLDVDGALMSTTDNGRVRVWNASQRQWDEVFQAHGTPGGPPFVQNRIGPIYDSANHRMLVVDRGWPNFRLLVGTRQDGWSGVELGAVPAEAFTLLNEPDGRVLCTTSSGLVRFRDQIMPAGQTPKLFGWEIPLPGAKGTNRVVNLEPSVSITSATEIAVNHNSGIMYVWKDGDLSCYERVGDGYKRIAQNQLSETAQRAVLAAGGEHLLVARADGVVQIVDQQLNVKSHFTPDDANPPRFARVSPNGRFFAVVFHTGRAWFYDAQEHASMSLRIKGQGDVSAVSFSRSGDLLVVHNRNRLSRYQLPDGKLVDRIVPTASLMENISRFGIDPVYTVFPKPGHLEETISYLLTERETTSLGDAEDLRSMHVKHDPWAPVWSSLAFTCVVLLISCIYIHRQEF